LLVGAKICKQCNKKSEEVLKDFKIKPLTKEQILISVDRLTRFKNTEDKYLRVFKDIITANLIYPKFKRQELDDMNYGELVRIAENILNYSLEAFGFVDFDEHLNRKLAEYENSVFEIDCNTQKLLDNKINYNAVVKLIPTDAPLNLKWLKALADLENMFEARTLHALRFPVEKLVICEGITEETLLPEFSRLLGYDFDRNGVYVLSAGGKNQVVKLFYKLVEICKLPIFVLMDSDAVENCEEIKPKLRAKDMIYLLKSGEFEDILPVKLLEKTLRYATENISLPVCEEIETGHTVEFLEEFFKHRGLHDFKKAEFAEMVKENLSDNIEVSDEIAEVIKSIKALGGRVDFVSGE